MAHAADLDALVPGNRTLRALDGGVRSALAIADEGAPYDGKAKFYDRLIGSPLYNRLIWGTQPAQYTAFAAEAFADGDGPFLDAGCGTALFTASVYAGRDRPLVLVDRSVGMLERAAERAGGPAGASLLQADLNDLPTKPSSFPTIGCFAMLHVLDAPWDALAALTRQLAPGGKLYASMLVPDRGGVSAPYLRMLHKRGELGPLRSAAELELTARELFPGGTVAVERIGSMAYLRATAA